MKLPKTVFICGKAWTVLRPNKLGGWLDSERQQISIGTKGKREYQLDCFLHECSEAILALRGLRLRKSDYIEVATDYVFVMSHWEFQTYIADLTSAIKDIV